MKNCWCFKDGLRTNGVWRPDWERMAATAIEAQTEYDWSELPENVKFSLTEAFTYFLAWQETQDKPLQGEIVIEQKELTE